MSNYLFRALILLSFPLVCILTSISGQDINNQTTVIISLDGFRWDYPDKSSTPNLDRIAKSGVKAVSLIPSFPSKTFPNHYTIATGLVPDHHGLVNNSFFNPVIGKPYSMGNQHSRFDPAYYGGEPIWITAQNQGIKTASFFWVGTDVAIQGKHPDLWKTYDGQIPFIQRIDTIISWLSLPFAERPKLIMGYYEEPDLTGHDYGPDDLRTLQVAHDVDSLIGILFDRIKQLPDNKTINLIIVSDHGMGTISSTRNVCIKDYISDSWPLRIEGGNPVFNIYADKFWTDSVFTILKEVPHISVWKPSEVPKHLNYGTNPNIGSLIVVADSAWSLTMRKPSIKTDGGTHGYDISNTDMHAIFYATGPAFRVNYVQPSFSNTDIYLLLAKILGLSPAKTDGNINDIIEMLK